jgi:hypothetical protein
VSVYNLKRYDLQPLVVAFADRLPSWKAGLLSHPGHTAQVRSTISAIPADISNVVKVSPVVMRDIDKIWRGFIWSSIASVTRGDVWWHGRR